MSPQAFSVLSDKNKDEEIIKKAIQLESPDYLEISGELYEIFAYLPELFQDGDEEKYINALSLAMQTSYDTGLYQFAYMQYHMLFMTAIYFILLKLYFLHQDEMEYALFYLLKDRYNDFFGKENTKEGQLYFGSFAAISESDVFKLLHIVGMDSNLEGELKKLVKERNDYAHANGRLLLTSEDFFLKKIRNFNHCIDKVFALIKKDILQLYSSTLNDPDFYDPDIRVYLDPMQQVREEIVRKYSFSRFELNWCRKYNIKQLESSENYESKKEIHIALSKYYKELQSEL